MPTSSAHARDPFSLPTLGWKPKLEDLLDALPGEVACDLAGTAGKASSIAKKHVSALSGAGKRKLYGEADLVLNGARLDRDEVDSLATKHGVKSKKSDSRHAIALLLLRKLGARKTREVLEEALAPGALKHHGSFANHEAPPLNVSHVQPLTVSSSLEASLEKLLSPLGQQRSVNVRAEVVKQRVIIGVYFERADTEGPKITSNKGNKTLTTDMFPRSAGTTYVVIEAGKGSKKSRVMFRSPSTKLARSLRPLVAQAVWKKGDAIADKPSTAYDLSVFLNSAFTLPVHKKHQSEVDKVTLKEIRVRAATGNDVNVKARGRKADALSDFRAISSRAKILTSNASVESVLVKFHDKRDGRRLIASAEIRPESISLDERQFELVNNHLRLWGILP